MIKILFSLFLISQHNYRANDYGFKNKEAWIASYDTAMVIYTLDAGTTWVYQNPGTILGFFDIFFIDSLRGWTGGEGGEIRFTDDGGNTWIRQVLGDTKWISRLQFLDSLHGYASAGDAIVKVTSDGGNTWFRVFTPFSGIDFYGISFIDTLTGFVCSGLPTIRDTPAYVAKSVDGGFTWDTLLQAPGYDFFDLHFFDEMNGIVVGGTDIGTDPVIFKTTDGGNIWDTIVPPGYYLRGLHFVSRQTGWAVGMFGTIIKTTDGGNTWAQQSSGVITTLFDVDFKDSLRGVASGQDAILFTGDGGQTWTPGLGVQEKAKFYKETVLKFPNILKIEYLKKYPLNNALFYDIKGRKILFDLIKPGVYFIKLQNHRGKVIFIE